MTRSTKRDDARPALTRSPSCSAFESYVSTSSPLLSVCFFSSGRAKSRTDSAPRLHAFTRSSSSAASSPSAHGLPAARACRCSSSTSRCALKNPRHAHPREQERSGQDAQAQGLAGSAPPLSGGAWGAFALLVALRVRGGGQRSLQASAVAGPRLVHSAGHPAEVVKQLCSIACGIGGASAPTRRRCATLGQGTRSMAAAAQSTQHQHRARRRPPASSKQHGQRRRRRSRPGAALAAASVGARLLHGARPQGHGPRAEHWRAALGHAGTCQLPQFTPAAPTFRAQLCEQLRDSSSSTPINK